MGGVAVEVGQADLVPDVSRRSPTPLTPTLAPAHGEGRALVMQSSWHIR